MGNNLIKNPLKMRLIRGINPGIELNQFGGSLFGRQPKDKK